jgi:hypothetical protein
VLVGVERDEAFGDECDVYPELDEPPAHHRCGHPDDGQDTRTTHERLLIFCR